MWCGSQWAVESISLIGEGRIKPRWSREPAEGVLELSTNTFDVGLLAVCQTGLSGRRGKEHGRPHLSRPMLAGPLHLG